MSGADIQPFPGEIAGIDRLLMNPARIAHAFGQNTGAPVFVNEDVR